MALGIGAPSMRLKLADDETEIDLVPLQGLWSVAQYLCPNRSHTADQPSATARPLERRAVPQANKPNQSPERVYRRGDRGSANADEIPPGGL